MRISTRLLILQNTPMNVYINTIINNEENINDNPNALTKFPVFFPMKNHIIKFTVPYVKQALVPSLTRIAGK